VAVRTVRLLIGSVLVLAGATALTVALVRYVRGSAWQRAQAVPDPILVTESREEPVLGLGEPIGRLSIPRIGLDLAVIEGTREEDLLKAPGHLAGSALPGAPDNCIIAGHRDLHFRRLGDLRPGDRVILEAGEKKVEYRVVKTRVVRADDTSILAPAREPLLTLITCYPFHYIGPAPRRFVVLASMVRAPGPAL
jgi:sortase A